MYTATLKTFKPKESCEEISIGESSPKQSKESDLSEGKRAKTGDAIDIL